MIKTDSDCVYFSDLFCYDPSGVPDGPNGVNLKYIKCPGVVYLYLLLRSLMVVLYSLAPGPTTTPPLVTITYVHISELAYTRTLSHVNIYI